MQTIRSPHERGKGRGAASGAAENLDEPVQRRRAGRKPPAYSPLTRAVADFLFRFGTGSDGKPVSLVDRLDWSYRDSDGRTKPAATNERYDEWLSGKVKYLPRLTATPIQTHLQDIDRISYRSDRCSGFALVRVDVDQHQGQTDGLDAVDFIRCRYFRGAYFEATPGGYAAFPIVRVGRIPRRRFNDLLARLADDLGLLCDEYGFEATVEVQGGFTIIDRELRKVETRIQAGSMPYFWHGLADLERLKAAPIFPPSVMDHVHRDATETRQIRAEGETPERKDRRAGGVLLDACVSSPRHATEKGYPRRDSDNAMERMDWAGWDFTCVFRRVPDVSELVEYYAGIYPCVATVDANTYRRAADVVRRREATFDLAKATEAGYEFYRGRLLEAVRTHCRDRTNKCGTRITDEDLAVGLYTVQRNSFSILEQPRRQWSCPDARLVGMFKALRGITGRAAGKRNKVTAVKRILERAGLIECIDPKYLPAGPKDGIGMKWVVGPRHWRHEEFQRFRVGVRVVYLKDRPAIPVSLSPVFEPTLKMAA